MTVQALRAYGSRTLSSGKVASVSQSSAIASSWLRDIPALGPSYSQLLELSMDAGGSGATGRAVQSRVAALTPPSFPRPPETGATFSKALRSHPLLVAVALRLSHGEARLSEGLKEALAILRA
jgi:hypothetical protein